MTTSRPGGSAAAEAFKEPPAPVTPGPYVIPSHELSKQATDALRRLVETLFRAPNAYEDDASGSDLARTTQDVR